MSGLLLAGDMQLDIKTDQGVSRGYSDAINATQLIVAQTVEQVDRISQMRSTYGTALDSVLLPGTPKLKFTTDDQGAELVSLLFRGNTEDYSVASAAGATQDVTVQLDKWVEFAPGGNTNTVSVATLTENTDFVVNHRTGFIKFLSTGSAVQGETRTVMYSQTAGSGLKVQGGTRTIIQVGIFLDGQNLANGKRVVWRAEKAVISPSGDTDLMAKQFVASQFEGSLVSVNGAAAFEYYELD